MTEASRRHDGTPLLLTTGVRPGLFQFDDPGQFDYSDVNRVQTSVSMKAKVVGLPTGVKFSVKPS